MDSAVGWLDLLCLHSSWTTLYPIKNGSYIMKKSEDGDINNWTCLIISSLLFYNDCFTGLKSLASEERWLFVAPPESSPSVEIGLEARPSQGPHVFFVAHRVPSQHLFWGRLLYGRLSEDVRRCPKPNWFVIILSNCHMGRFFLL